MFLAGNKQGETYSFLSIGSDAFLSGLLQIVLQPEIFGYLPPVGATFDLIHANQGITLDDGFLGLDAFVTKLGADSLGISGSLYSSGIASDPDVLISLSEDFFSFELVDNSTTLRVTFNGDFAAIPEPATSALICGLAAMAYMIRRRCKGSTVSSANVGAPTPPDYALL